MSQVADWSKEVDDEDDVDEDVALQTPATNTTTQDAQRPRDSHEDNYQRNSKPPREKLQIPLDGPTPFVSTVLNLPFRASADEIGMFFAGGGCAVHDIIIHCVNGRPSGGAFVYFDNEDSMRRSEDANDVVFNGRNIRVYANRPKSRYDKSSIRRSNDDGRGPRDGRGPEPRKSVPDTPAESENVWTRKIDPNPAPKVEVKPFQPTERKALNLMPRSAPIEDIGKPLVASASIFGEGKPRDETALEVSNCNIHTIYLFIH